MEYNQKEHVKKRIGNNVKALRVKAGMSRKELADSISRTESFIGLVERSVRGTSNESLFRICSVFGVSLDDLLNTDLSEDTLTEAREQSDADIYKQILSVIEGASRGELLRALSALKDAGLLNSAKKNDAENDPHASLDDDDIKY